MLTDTATPWQIGLNSTFGCTPFTTDNPDQARQHLTRYLWPHSVNPGGHGRNVHFSHARRNLSRIEFNAVQYGAPVSLNITPNSEDFLLLIILDGDAEACQQDRTTYIPQDHAYVFNPNNLITLNMTEETRNITIRLDGGLLNDLRLRSGECDTPLEFSSHAISLTNEATGLARFLSALTDDMASDRQSFSLPTVLPHVELGLASLLLAEMPRLHASRKSVSDSMSDPCGVVPGPVRRAQRFIHDNASEALNVGDIAEAAGTSTRALQLNFKRFLGVSPVTYIRNHRLDLARRALKSAGVSGESVTEIALASGFDHLSKFALYYQQRFGEKPSATLAHARAHFLTFN